MPSFLDFKLGSRYDPNLQSAQNESKPCSKLVMYSASWCPHCTRKSKELRYANVSFTEHFVDKDPVINKIFREKARAANIRIAYPRFEVDGVLLPKNYETQSFIKYYNICLN